MSKKFLMSLALAAACACAFAGSSGDSDDVSGTILEKLSLVIGVLYSPWVKGLFGCVVGFKAVSFIVNHEQGTFKKLLPVAGAALLYFLSPSIVNKLMTVQGYKINTSTGAIEKTSD